MSKGRGLFEFILFTFLSVIFLLQIAKMVQSDRLFRCLNRIDDIYQGVGISQDNDVTAPIAEPRDGSAGDWLVWAFRVEPKTLNQYSAENDIYSRWITVPYIFEPLLVYDFNDLSMKPWLAEKYSISDDGLEYTFELREDAYFSDGEPVAADDVIFTYNTATDPNVDAANIANLFIDVEKAVKVDKRTVKFIMKRPYFKALENLCFWDLGILPKHEYKYEEASEFNSRVSNPVGSGPFVFERWDVGQQVILKRNENYWGQKPKLEKIVYKFITNPVACVQALRSHKVDVIIPQPDQYADLVKDEEFREDFHCFSYWNPGAPFYYIGWNQDTVWFSDRRVRLAMTHMINREKIISKLLKGHARKTTGPFFIKGKQNAPDVKGLSYDLEKAKALLNEAGWVDGDGDGVRDKNGEPFRFKFSYASDNILYQRLAKYLKNQSSKVGIEIILEPLEWSVLIVRITNREFESMVMGWGGDILEDPYQLWHSSQIGNRGSNYVGFNNSVVDSLIEKGCRTLDEQKRNGIYHKLHRILHREQPYTFLFARPTFRLVDKRFENIKIYTLGPKYWQWYVPKEKQRYD